MLRTIRESIPSQSPTDRARHVSQFLWMTGSQATPAVMPTKMPMNESPTCHRLKSWLVLNTTAKACRISLLRQPVWEHSHQRRDRGCQAGLLIADTDSSTSAREPATALAECSSTELSWPLICSSSRVAPSIDHLQYLGEVAEPFCVRAQASTSQARSIGSAAIALQPMMLALPAVHAVHTEMMRI